MFGEVCSIIRFFFKWNLPDATPQRPESADAKSEVGEHKGSWLVGPPELLAFVTGTPPATPFPGPNGGKACDGINPLAPLAPLTPLDDRKTLLVFFLFFHLARRFWNQTL